MSADRRTTSLDRVALLLWAGTFLVLIALGLAHPAQAHGVGARDAAFVASSAGPQPFIFLYLGAKHMLTGYDHLLFLLGVIFFLRRLKDVALYVTLFSVGHSITLVAGVLGHLQVNPFLVDAVIGLSVAYKAFDNLGGPRALLATRPDPRLAVLAFGLVHGLGLATKLQALNLSREGLLINLLSFNLGVELGQLTALTLMLGLVVAWRSARAFNAQAIAANAALMAAGFLLCAYQAGGYFWES